MSKKKRRPIFDPFGEDSELSRDFERRLLGNDFGGGGGYSIQVTYENDRPTVSVKIHGNVDRERLREQLKKQYPNAKILGFKEEKPLIREISDDEKKG